MDTVRLPDRQSIRRLKRPKRVNCLEDMQRLGRERGLNCLSKAYVNMSTKMLWGCELGHQFELTPDSVRNGMQGCPECSRLERRQQAWEQAVTRAREQFGECLGGDAAESTVMQLICQREHRFELTVARVLRGDWCPQCAGARKRR